MTVCLTCDPLALRSASLDEVVREIGRALLCPLAVSEQRADRILLEEEPPLSVQTGIASACAAGTERKRQKVDAAIRYPYNVPSPNCEEAGGYAHEKTICNTADRMPALNIRRFIPG